MIRHIYDSEVKALYIYLDEPQDRVGTLEVKGDIKFRKPGKIVPFEDTLLLDFTEEGSLVGIEVLGNRIPKCITNSQPLSAAKVELRVRPGASINDVMREANSIFSSLASTGIKPEVSFTFNDSKYTSNGYHCEKVNND